MRERLLFICTFNMSRSFTAERLFRDHARYEVRSAGTHHSAITLVDAELIRWADRVIVMEEHHRETLAVRFPSLIPGKPVLCLHIPDDYQPLAEELVQILTDRLRLAGIQCEDEPEEEPG